MKRTLKRRRKENKTNYLKRMNLLKSEKPRLIFRRTNKYFVMQYIYSESARDKIVFGFTSKELLKYGWPKTSEGSLKSIPASYLSGFLIGKNILSKKLKTPIVDLGMTRTLYKTRVYSFLKGLIDSGLKINCKNETFPDEKTICGQDLKNKIDFEKIKTKMEKI